MSKKRLSIMDLANRDYTVDISEEEEMVIHPLTLTQLLNVFANFRESFLSLYTQFMSGAGEIQLGQFLLSAPSMVAHVIALSTSPDSEEQFAERAVAIQTNMAGTVQLIALKSIWEISVPDPKKARELLSEVTAQLKKLQVQLKDGDVTPIPEPKTSLTPSAEASNSSSPTDTPSET